MISFPALLFVVGLALRALPYGELSNPIPDCTLTVDGELNHEVLEKLELYEDCRELFVQVSSVGGEGLVSLAIARELQRRNATIQVHSHCFSSCAEFILPAAKRVLFRSRPLVGFHGNPAMKEYLANVTEPRGYESCSFEESDAMYELYFEATVNYEFWKSQLDRLELQSFGVENVQGDNICPKMGFNFKHEMWFPSSKDLKNDFKLEFEGAVCADQIEECTGRVLPLFKDRGTFVIDDVVVGGNQTMAETRDVEGGTP